MKKEQLAALTVKELKVIAKENGLKGYSKLRKAELVEMLAVEVETTKVTFEEVCNQAPNEFHYWNGDNEGMSVYDFLTTHAYTRDFPVNKSSKEKVEFLIKENDYIIEEIWCNGKNYKKPNQHTMSGETYYEDRKQWKNTVNELLSYKSYLKDVLSIIEDETDPVSILKKIDNEEITKEECPYTREGVLYNEDLYVNFDNNHKEVISIELYGITYTRKDVDMNSKFEFISQENSQKLKFLLEHKHKTQYNEFSCEDQKLLGEMVKEAYHNHLNVTVGNMEINLHHDTIYCKDTRKKLNFDGCWYELIEYVADSNFELKELAETYYHILKEFHGEFWDDNDTDYEFMYKNFRIQNELSDQITFIQYNDVTITVNLYNGIINRKEDDKTVTIYHSALNEEYNNYQDFLNQPNFFEEYLLVEEEW